MCITLNWQFAILLFLKNYSCIFFRVRQLLIFLFFLNVHNSNTSDFISRSLLKSVCSLKGYRLNVSGSRHLPSLLHILSLQDYTIQISTWKSRTWARTLFPIGKVLAVVLLCNSSLTHFFALMGVRKFSDLSPSFIGWTGMQLMMLKTCYLTKLPLLFNQSTLESGFQEKATK